MDTQENAPKRSRANTKSLLTDLYIEIDDLMLRRKQDHDNKAGKVSSEDWEEDTTWLAGHTQACEQVKRLVREKM